MSTVAPRKVSDPRAFGRVGLVIGGDSAEREVSLNGGRAVGAALERSGIDYQVFDGPLALFDAIGRGEIDRVFNLLHGPGWNLKCSTVVKEKFSCASAIVEACPRTAATRTPGRSISAALRNGEPGGTR